MAIPVTAVDYFFQRSGGEEGDRKKAYNDATGKTVTCQPSGNLSIGRGINLEVGLDDEEDEWFFRHRAGKTYQALLSYDWFRSLDPVRQSAVLDIGYNAGLEGLLHYPHMISALAVEDWQEAAQQCTTTNSKLQARYLLLAHILLTGSISA